MNKGINNYLVWIIVLALEWLILKIAQKPQLWLYVSIPIVVALIYTEISGRPSKSKRNLR
jgi:hypothetical protein